MTKDLDVDTIIEQLLATNNAPGKQVQLPESQIRQLCQISRGIFLEQPNLLEVGSPITIVGDIHGQFTDMISHFDKCGYPGDTNYLFLGDYVDRGKRSLETICLLLAYKIRYPNNFFLLRGNHECASINRIYGFYDECKRRYNIKLWKTFTDCFNCLPLAAVVENTIFCTHGGLSPELQDMNQNYFVYFCRVDVVNDVRQLFHELAAIPTYVYEINAMERPIDVPDHGLVCDLLWSDPDEDITGWGENDRGVSFTFGGDVVREFLKKHNLSLIARGHQVVEDGYQFFEKRQLVTLFSAPNYCGEFDNAGGVMQATEDLLCSFKILKPLKEKTIAEKKKKKKK